jgi:hypothetical protein
MIDHSEPPPKKINEDTSELNCTIDQMDIRDSYRIFDPTAVDSSQQSIELSPK